MKKILDKNVVHSDLTGVEEIEIVHPAIALSNANRKECDI